MIGTNKTQPSTSTEIWNTTKRNKPKQKTMTVVQQLSQCLVNSKAEARKTVGCCSHTSSIIHPHLLILILIGSNLVFPKPNDIHGSTLYIQFLAKPSCASTVGSITVLTVTLEMRGSSPPGCSLIGTSASTKSAWLVASFLTVLSMQWY